MLEELGSDSHVIFAIDAPRVEAEELKAAADNEEEALIADDRAVWNARVDAKTAGAGRRRGSGWRSTPRSSTSSIRTAASASPPAPEAAAAVA